MVLACVPKRETAWAYAKSGTCTQPAMPVEAIPDDAAQWDVAPPVRGAANLANTLASGRAVVSVFKDLATLRTAAIVDDTVVASVVRPTPGD